MTTKWNTTAEQASALACDSWIRMVANMHAGEYEIYSAENLAIDRAKKLFGAEAANVQPHSGSQANTAVYLSCLEPGDHVLGLDLAHVVPQEPLDHPPGDV